MESFLYPSPLGPILLTGDDHALTGLSFPEEPPASPMGASPVAPPLQQTCLWLDLYFAGRVPEVLPPLAPSGTSFQQQVWGHLLRLPYGATRTYGELARELAAERGLPRLAPQAVGAALARNPILLLIPCHRILGARGALTGYAGGLPRKQALLAWEKNQDISPWPEIFPGKRDQ